MSTRIVPVTPVSALSAASAPSVPAPGRVKYPRTPHLPWSPGFTADDLHHRDLRRFDGQEVVVTEKMDGENTSLYRDAIHARSLDSAHHPSRAWVKGLHGRIAHLIPEGWRLCGENCYAVHSLTYAALPSYFFLFSIWDEQNSCLGWTETEEWAALLELELPPVLYRGPFSERRLRGLTAGLDPERQEGIVVRLAAGFSYGEFGQSVAKWVRAGHVTTDQFWMSRPVVPNGLACVQDDMINDIKEQS